MVYLPKKWGIIVHLLLFLRKKYPFLPKKCTFMAVSSEEIPLFCTFMVISSEEINVISSEIMSKNSSFQPFQKIFEVLLSWFSHKKFNLYKNVHLCVFFPKKYPFSVQLRQYLPKKWGIIVHLLLFLRKKYPFLPKKFYGLDMKKATFSRTSLQSKSVKSPPFRVGVPLTHEDNLK